MSNIDNNISCQKWGGYVPVKKKAYILIQISPHIFHPSIRVVMKHCFKNTKDGSLFTTTTTKMFCTVCLVPFPVSTSLTNRVPSVTWPPALDATDITLMKQRQRVLTARTTHRSIRSPPAGWAGRANREQRVPSSGGNRKWHQHGPEVLRQMRSPWHFLSRSTVVNGGSRQLLKFGCNLNRWADYYFDC